MEKREKDNIKRLINNINKKLILWEIAEIKRHLKGQLNLS
jgi:hypothetical protein